MNNSEHPLNNLKGKKKKKREATASEEGGRVWILSKNPALPLTRRLSPVLYDSPLCKA